MRSKEFITEAPLPDTPEAVKPLFKQVYQHQYREPGDLWDDWNDDPDDDNPSGVEYPFTRANKLRHVGTGAEAAVVRYDDANSVFKILGTTQQLGFNLHLQYLLATKKYANSNPYFPRIDSVTTIPYISNRGGGVTGYVIKMERLFPAHDLDEEQRDVILRRIYGDEADNIVHDNVNHLARSIKYGVIGRRVEMVIDPAFKQARELIIAVASKVKSKYPIDNLIDIHASNIMVRQSKFGPQLVISDPLYNGDERESK